MNDSLRTDIFLRFTPETIACACIDLAARTLQVKLNRKKFFSIILFDFKQISLPKNPPWFIIFGTQPEDIHYIMIAILRLYKHRPVRGFCFGINLFIYNFRNHLMNLKNL
jgi:hypothetical protein